MESLHCTTIYLSNTFSSYQGWDNPFRPEGELSHDAEEILRLWKAGKLKEVSSILQAAAEELQDEVDNRKEKKNDDDNNKAQQPFFQNGKQQQIKNGQSKPVPMDVKTSSSSQPQKVLLPDSEPKKKKGCCSLMWN